MIKSKIIMLLVGCALTASVWGGGYVISKSQKPQTEVTENNSKINNLDEYNKESDKNDSTKEDIENNKEDANVFEEDNSVTSDSGNLENNKPEGLYPNTNNQNNNKSNQFEDNKIDESIFDISNINTNNGTSTESENGTTVEEFSNVYIAQTEQAIFQIVNKERAANGLSALTYNGTMEYYARYKSKDMGDEGYFNHHDLNGELITAKMKRDGVSYNAWAENIAYIQGSYDNVFLAAKFMDNWMNLSGHRANILSSNFSSIGIGVYKVGKVYYATQEFFK